MWRHNLVNKQFQYTSINISRSKGNQAMKFDQLYSISWEIFFLKNNSQNGLEILPVFPDLFLNNQNWAYLWINSLTFYIQIVFIVCQVEDYRNVLKRGCRPFAFTSNKAFLKKTKRSGTSLPASYFRWFWRKIFLLLYSITRTNFTVWLPLLREILGDICIVIAC